MNLNDRERRFYNIKLLKKSFIDELKHTKFDKKEIIISIIGIVLGFIVKSSVNVSAHIGNYLGILIIEVLIITVCILLVRTVVWAAEKLLRRN